MNDKWKLIPVEPTDEMLSAHAQAAFENDGYYTQGERQRVKYRAMLAAAPQPLEPGRCPHGVEPHWTCQQCLHAEKGVKVFGFDVHVDPTLPPDVMELRTANQTVRVSCNEPSTPEPGRLSGEREALPSYAPLEHPLHDYWIAPSGEGPLAATWADKPHRLLYDLIRAAAGSDAECRNCGAPLPTSCTKCGHLIRAAAGSDEGADDDKLRDIFG
jgi:hypothetical protein